MQERRVEFREIVKTIDPAKLVFVDEAGATTTMTRLRGRAAVGERVVDLVPHGHYSVTTMVGAIRCNGVAAGLMFEGATDTIAFATFVEQSLSANLEPGDVVVMDNLSSHKATCIRELIERAGARLQLLPPYSPDLNPIEKMWSKVKAFLRAAGTRTKESLWNAICEAFHAVTPTDCQGFFASCGIPVAATPARQPL